jgi:hypothetical protein
MCLPHVSQLSAETKADARNELVRDDILPRIAALLDERPTVRTQTPVIEDGVAARFTALLVVRGGVTVV